MERLDENIPRYTLSHQRIVQVSIHEPAYLHCIIPQFSKNLVAWTRVNDEALLTAGELSFTTDPRFQVSLKPSESDWVLIIRRVEKSDSGCYLCEVNTEPKSIVYAVYLNVIERTTKLMANLIGNEVLLNCTITTSNGSTLDEQVMWLRDGKPIDFTRTNKYISKVKRDSRTIVHTLRILRATSEDDGNYACSAIDAPESSHMLHVNSSMYISLKFDPQIIYFYFNEILQ
ncbi:unnamed protein product [Dracunculus medinensis]|uniref:Ig-like domain-containing protein n=1 Tax=Dracunculus medinensis TaxID=318479 RepID=A0A0N4UED5_DRAME|nr:unnamed protein product [Dracunculus medinensis]